MDNQMNPAMEGSQIEQNGQATLFDLQAVTINSSLKVSDLQEEVKIAKQMLEDALMNDDVYKEKQQSIKDRQKDLKMERAQIESQPALAVIVRKIKDLRSEIKEKKAEISEYAVQVMLQTGANEIEKDGEVYEIQTVAKLAKRKA